MSRQYRPGDVAYVTFPVFGATGALANADSLPTAKVVKNGAIDVTVTVTVNAALQTGVYSASYTIPIGYSAGDDVEVFAFATVGGVAAGDRVDAFRLVGWGPTALPNAAPGASGGVFVAGSNAATTVNFTGSLTGSVGSVTGSVASVTGSVATVTGNVGGSVTGDVGGKVLGGGSSTITAVGVNANATQFLGHAVVVDSNYYPAVNVVDVAGSAASVVAGPVDSNVVSVGGTGFSGTTVPGDLQAIKGNNVICNGVVTVPLSIGTSTLTAAQVRDVDNTSPAGGSLGAKVNSASAAGDPWSTNLPGSYSGSTAGSLFYNRLDAAVSSRSTFAGGAVASVTAPVTAGTVTDKAGYALSSAGLDAISAAPQTGVPTTFRGWLMWLARRLGGKATNPTVIGSSGTDTLKVYDTDGTTLLTTQTVTDSGTTQTLGPTS